MHVFGRLCIAALAGAPASVSLAQLRAEDQVPLDQDQRVRYDGDDLVDAFVEDQAQLDALEKLAVTIWSERPGLGHVEVQLREGDVQRLDQLGISHRTIHGDVQQLIDEEWSELQLRAQQRGGSWYDSYHQYNDVVAHLNDLATAYPAMTAMDSAGLSLQGRDIPVLHITGPGDASQRPIIFINACQHAREWISPAVVMYIAEHLLEGYGSDARVTDLLDHVEFEIAPISNPDGYIYTWTNDRLWRKNLRGGYGVDLNRNWGWHWGGEGSSNNTSSEVYHGSAPFSEPETQALRDFALAQTRIVASIDYHSFSQLILWPWGYDYVDPPAPIAERFSTIGLGMRDAMLGAGGVPYTAEPSYDLYLAAGNAVDWFYGQLDALAYTIELRDTGFYGFVLPPSQIIPTAEENWAAFLYFAEQATQPISISIPGGAPATIDADEGATLEVMISDAASSYAFGTAMLHTSVNGGSFSAAPLTAVGGDQFEGSLPAAACGSTVSFYITAEVLEGGTVALPAAGGAAPFEAVALETSVVFQDDMETGEVGWQPGLASDTATTGVWNLGDPQGTGAQPEDDNTADPGHVCWCTGTSAGGSIGGNDVDGGVTTLTSPRLNAAAGAADGMDAYLTYARWYSNDQGASPNADSMPILISNDDGVTWTQLEDVSENLGRWERKEFNIADFVTPTDQIRVRFIARDLGAGSIVEAGVDDVRVEIRGCACAPADVNCDGELDFFDVQLFLDRFAAHDPAADFNSDGEFNFFDVQLFLDLFSAG